MVVRTLNEFESLISHSKIRSILSMLLFDNYNIRVFLFELDQSEFLFMNSTTHFITDESNFGFRFDQNLTIKDKSQTLTYVFPEHNVIVMQSGMLMDSNRIDISADPPGETTIGFLTTEGVDAVTNKASYTDLKSLLPNEYSGGTDGIDSERNIKEFLATPIVEISGNLSSTDTASTFSNINVGNSLFSNAILQEKLKGFHSIRYDTVVTIEFNANRFQTGRYILAFCPTGGATAAGPFINSHRFSKTQITQLPHVEFDLNCDTKAQLRIPFISCQNSVRVMSTGIPRGIPGVFFLYPYVPLGSTAGSTLASYTLWTHYENVTLFSAAIPQSGIRKQKNSKDLITTEVNKMGPISKTLSFVTDVSTALTGVPLLSSIAGPVSWVSDALAKAAYSFGWSAPILLAEPHRMVREVVPYLAVSDAHKTAVPLSMCANNHVSVLPGFAGTDQDELAIDFLKTIPSWYRTDTWFETMPAGHLLLNVQSSPAFYFTTQTDGTASLTSFTPIAFLAELYSLWRGSLRYTFKFVKTEFHSGRLLFVWTAMTSEGGSSAIPTIANSPYVHKTIIDVREGNEFTVEVPFASVTNFNTTEISDYGASGNIALIVLDPLRAPATVSSSISIIVEVSGGPDLTFAVPNRTNMMPVLPISLQSGVSPDCEIISTTVGTTQLNTVSPLTYCEISTGEAMTSLRQYLKRGSFVQQGVEPSVTALTIYPFATTYLLGTAGAPTGTAITDPYNLISSLYCLSRGGMRISGFSSTGASTGFKFVSIQRAVSGATVSALLNTFTASASQFNWDANCTGIAPVLLNQGGWSVQVPQQTRGHSRSTWANSFYSSTPFTTTDNGCDTTYLETRQNGVGVADYIYRAGADDINLGGFVSIPPLVNIGRP